MAKRTAVPVDLQERLDRLRRLDRLYSHFLDKRHPRTPIEDFNAADVRVILELGFVAGGCSGTRLGSRLSLDEGYVCRTLKKLEAGGLVTSRRSGTDGRMREWELTRTGRAFAANREAEWRDMARWTLIALTADEQRRLAEAMTLIESVLLRYEMRGTR